MQVDKINLFINGNHPPILLRKGMVYAKEFLSAFSERPRKKKKKQPKATLNLSKHPLLNIKIKNSTCFNSQKEKILAKDLHKDEHHFTVTGQ